MRKSLVILFLLFAICTSISSQIEIDKVIVTGTKTSQRLRDSGRNIQIISKQEIDQMPVHSVDDLLRSLPGLEVQSRGGFGVQGDITLRGATFNQIVILIDGARLYDPLTGHFNGYIPISLAEIQKIEIIKGGATTLYGPDAVGGVINIITAVTTFTSNLTTVEAKTGSHGYNGLEATVYQDKKKWKIGGGMQFHSSDGEERINPNFASSNLGPETYNNHFKMQNYSAVIGRELTDQLKFHFRSAYDSRQFDAKYFYTASAYDESKENIQVLFNQLHIDHIGDNHKTVVDVTHRYGDDEFIFNPLFAKNFNRTQFYQFQAHHSRVPNESLKVGVGFQGDYRLVYSLDRGDHQNLHYGGYATANYYKNNWVLNGGLRADYDDSYDLEWSPSLSFAYHISKSNIRGSVNRTIRAADFTERYVSTNLEFLSAERNLGNPNLQAESAWNYELGFDFNPDKAVLFNATIFSRNAINLIDYSRTLSSDISNVNVSLADSSYYFYSKNISSVNTSGVELEMKYNRALGERFFINAMAGYTYLDTKTDDDQISKYISNHSKHLVNGIVTVGNKKTFNVFVQGLWKHRKTAFSDVLDLGVKKDYLMLSSGIRLRPQDQNIQFSLEVNNIGNVQAQDIYGALLPGRWFMGSMKVWL